MEGIKKILLLDRLVEWFINHGIDYGKLFVITGVVILYSFFSNTEQSFGAVLSLFFLTAPFWLTYMVFKAAHYKWVIYVRKRSNLAAGRTSLEIKLPPEVLKSPRAMETVLNQMWNVSTPKNIGEVYWGGKHPPTYGLEIVSRGGEVKFYINTPTKKFKDVTEVQLYSQYPGVEVHEVDIDYTAEISADSDEYELFSMHMNKKGDKIMPMGTYIDHGLDDMPKEEEKIDPLTTWLDNLGSIGPDERLWIQILIKAHKNYPFSHGGFSWSIPKDQTFEAQIAAKIDEVMMRDPATKSAPVEADGQPRLTQEERGRADALERKASKPQFETAIRFIYAARKGRFNGGNISSTLRSFAAFDVIGRNEIGYRWRTDFNHKWLSDPTGKRIAAYKKAELTDYKLRRHFNYALGLKDNPCLFSSEEVATIWHLPGKVALTPTLSRVQSTRSEAPANLPTGQA